MLNPFSLNGSVGEQNLIQSLVNEVASGCMALKSITSPESTLLKNTVIREGY